LDCYAFGGIANCYYEDCFSDISLGTFAVEKELHSFFAAGSSVFSDSDKYCLCDVLFGVIAAVGPDILGLLLSRTEDTVRVTRSAVTAAMKNKQWRSKPLGMLRKSSKEVLRMYLLMGGRVDDMNDESSSESEGATSKKEL
jgi:hypothetical protein